MLQKQTLGYAPTLTVSQQYVTFCLCSGVGLSWKSLKNVDVSIFDRNMSFGFNLLKEIFIDVIMKVLRLGKVT